MEIWKGGYRSYKRAQGTEKEVRFSRTLTKKTSTGLDDGSGIEDGIVNNEVNVRPNSRTVPWEVSQERQY